MKISENVLQKSLWQSLENEKSEMAIFFVFSCSSSWCTLFFLSMHFSWRKLWNKITCFDFFEKKAKKDEKYRVKQGGGKVKKNRLFWLFWKKLKKGDFVSQFSPCIDRKKQSIPRWRARKNKEDGSLHFFHRPPESGLILHRSCVIYDGQH